MSDTAGVRWYRHGGGRLMAAIMISFLGVPAAGLAVYGIGDPVGWMFLVPGAVLVAGIAVLTCLPFRAGIGVTPEHILVRPMLGATRAVPWEQVTGFEVAEGPKGKGGSKGEDIVFVLTSGGERLHTGGYSPGGSSPTDAWQLLGPLEAERLARTPGAVSTLPAPPPPGRRMAESSPFFVVLGVLALIAFGAFFMPMGVAEIGPAIQASHGGGTVGYFVPGPIPGGKAEAFGDFRLADGTVTRRDTRIEDVSKADLRAGVPVPARDTGDPDGVCRRNDRGAWHGAAFVLIGASWCLGWALIVITRAGVRWLCRARRDDDGHVTALPRLRARTRFQMPNRVICAYSQRRGHLFVVDA